MNGQINDLAFIKLVEAYPILYCKDQARGVKNAELKDRAWKEISHKLNASERACITRWKSIRDRFGKEFRRVQDNPDEPTNWDIFPQLLFLIGHYKHGTAMPDSIASIKYQPKERKRKGRPPRNSNNATHLDDECNEQEIDPYELQTNQQLIALVKEHDVLYDKCKIRDSKNVAAKNEAWSEISQTLCITEVECYKRWKRLRDRFAREYRYKQITPSKLVTWIYFEDLTFLEAHYRKGIPLNVDTLKRTGRPKQEHDNKWIAEFTTNYNNSIDNAEQHDLDVHDESTFSDSIEHYDNFETPQTLDDLLLISPSATKEALTPVELPQNDDTTDSSTLDAAQTITLAADDEEAEEKLHDVICNMETVLKQSKDCLQALQQQKQRHKAELEANVLSVEPLVIQKVHLLLGDLNEQDRNVAERKILRFLCECQIKLLNNEDIEDVQPVRIS